MYKIIVNTIIKNPNSPNRLFIPQEPANSDYQQFIKDVAEQGYDIVEGPTIHIPQYDELRRAEYPPIEDQLDKIYHEGVDAWKAEIQAIKEATPKTTFDADELERRKQAVRDHLSS